MQVVLLPVTCSSSLPKEQQMKDETVADERSHRDGDELIINWRFLESKSIEWQGIKLHCPISPAYSWPPEVVNGIRPLLSSRSGASEDISLIIRSRERLRTNARQMVSLTTEKKRNRFDNAISLYMPKQIGQSNVWQWEKWYFCQ